MPVALLSQVSLVDDFGFTWGLCGVQFHTRMFQSRCAMIHTKIEAQKAFDKWHDVLQVDAGADAPWHRAVKAYLPKLGILDGKQVLEIGCGRGGFACWFAANYPKADLIAADFSPSAVRQGQSFAVEHGLKGIQWRVEDIQAISFPSSTFDIAISCETVEHLLDPSLAVAELARVLKPGGTLVLTTPNYANLMGLYRGYMRLTGRRFAEEGQPINRFTNLPRTRRWLRQAGLTVRYFDSVGIYVPFPRRRPILVHMCPEYPVLRWFGLHSILVAKRADTSNS
jgi:ubiquinone/menaquinone biosynthesis C-methylase UbiE